MVSKTGVAHSGVTSWRRYLMAALDHGGVSSCGVSSLRQYLTAALDHGERTREHNDLHMCTFEHCMSASEKS
jgi:hypothetical protein